jgi:hypothetical protein
MAANDVKDSGDSLKKSIFPSQISHEKNQMKKIFSPALLLPLLLFFSRDHQLSTKTGKVSFSSPSADHSNIKAASHTAHCSISKKSGDINFTVTINDFTFEEAGMQDVFRQLLQSDQHPTAGFSGLIAGFEKIDLTTMGKFILLVKGALTLHGVTREIQTRCVLKVNAATVQATAAFPVSMKDFKIENPIGNDTILITVDCLLQ